jgi:hypothetical protein
MVLRDYRRRAYWWSQITRPLAGPLIVLWLLTLYYSLSLYDKTWNQSGIVSDSHYIVSVPLRRPWISHLTIIPYCLVFVYSRVPELVPSVIASYFNCWFQLSQSRYVRYVCTVCTQIDCRIFFIQAFPLSSVPPHIILYYHIMSWWSHITHPLVFWLSFGSLLLSLNFRIILSSLLLVPCLCDSMRRYIIYYVMKSSCERDYNNFHLLRHSKNSLYGYVA